MACLELSLQLLLALGFSNGNFFFVWKYYRLIKTVRPQRIESISEQIEVLRASISRACGPSFGTICLAAILETSIGTVLLILRGLRRVSKIELSMSGLISEFSLAYQKSHCPSFCPPTVCSCLSSIQRPQTLHV